MAVAKRPLNVQELREAIGIVPLQVSWNPGSFINDMKKAMACCGNLLFVDEEQQTVHFTHSSVLQYLRSDMISKSLAQYFIVSKKADADAGATCVTYLNLPVFNTQLARTVDFNTAAIPSKVVESVLPARNSPNRLALHLLRRQNKSGKSVQRLLEDTAGDDEPSRQNAMLEQHVFFPYAQKFWLYHARQRIISKSGKFSRLFNNLLEDSHWRGTLAGIPWTFEDWENRSPNAIEWIAENNHCLLAQLLIDSERDLTQDNLQTLIEAAARRGHAELVEVCLGSQSISQRALDSALKSAILAGHLTVVERLLQDKVDVTATEALQLAAREGHLAIVERLLKETSDVTVTKAIHSAAASGHLAIIERLFQEKAYVDLTVSDGDTALHWAVKSGYLAIVEHFTLEGANVNVNAINNHEETALHLAARNGRLAIVERLLQKGADVNFTTRFDSQTALYLAAKNGHLAIVERLLQEGADVNATNNPTLWTALHLAAERGHLAVVEKLLQEGADVNATNSRKQTALHLAADKGYPAIVKQLLQEGADVNAVNIFVDTALHIAAKKGDLAIVEKLLQRGADVNATNKDGLTARHMAWRHGHEDVEERLKAAGGKM